MNNMIAELVTTIQLRRDTLDNWNNSTRILQPGEAAVAYVDVESVTADGELTTIPAVLLKVGDMEETPTKTFKQLPFMSAIAADVSGWAKKPGIDIVDTETGQYVTSIEWVNDKIVVHRG